MTAAFARDCRSGKRLALVHQSTRLFSSHHQCNLTTLHLHSYSVSDVTCSRLIREPRIAGVNILMLPDNGRWWQVWSPLIKQCQARHLHQCASTPDLSLLMLLFLSLPSTSKPPDNTSGLEFLIILVQHAPNSVQGSTCPNPPYINVLATPISFHPVPSPSRTSPDDFLRTIHPFVALIVEHHS